MSVILTRKPAITDGSRDRCFGSCTCKHGHSESLLMMLFDMQTSRIWRYELLLHDVGLTEFRQLKWKPCC